MIGWDCRECLSGTVGIGMRSRETDNILRSIQGGEEYEAEAVSNGDYYRAYVLSSFTPNVDLGVSDSTSCHPSTRPLLIHWKVGVHNRPQPLQTLTAVSPSLTCCSEAQTSPPQPAFQPRSPRRRVTRDISTRADA